MVQEYSTFLLPATTFLTAPFRLVAGPLADPAPAAADRLFSMPKTCPASTAQRAAFRSSCRSAPLYGLRSFAGVAHLVPIGNLNSNILMMQSTQDWQGQRERAEIRRSRMPIARRRRMKASPYAPSRSRTMYRGGSLQPQASVSGRAPSSTARTPKRRDAGYRPRTCTPSNDGG